MAKSKRKGQQHLPDRRLAGAFRFSAVDLAANRSGYMSLAQKWALPPLWQRAFAWLLNRLPSQSTPPIRKVTGRAHLKHHQYQIFAIHRTELRERFSVQFASQVFSLTAQQYRVLSQDVLYDVYCTADEQTILSLERAVHHTTDG
ncbi:hypothetical protein G4Y79_23480 [Phototrophicus methaneseepsis]|uniref:Uncharacterized protein n=1 Tax=Phototrophicus methaneseepsis TaxID=2710758 RepID=A0A7S8E917_9CHLR|nr:hypothetical protein [Phototrophicus methaneseepsis]QPC82614.1 hypothetical protein G4Y79_23480 [Phototrophicus methaneseepsis]